MSAANDCIASGLGTEDFPGFPAESCPEVLPDLSPHHSSLADVLKQQPDLYPRLKCQKTKLGVGLARCIKVGMDNRGHPMVKTIGVVAGDEECYEVFRDLFDPVMAQHLMSPSFQIGDSHKTNLATQSLSLESADPSGRFVLSSKVSASRSLRGFRFPPAMTLEERHDVERISVRALQGLDGPLRGEYFPLGGSQSHAEKPGGMGPEDEARLRKSSLLFEAPDSNLRLCTGAGRHWPEGRGVFVNGSETFAVWVNEQEHLRLVASRPGARLHEAFVELVTASDQIAGAIRRNGSERSFTSEAFAWSKRLGYLTSNPANLGSAMHISVMVQLPLLGSLEAGSTTPSAWTSWCAKQRVQVCNASSESGLPVPGLFEISNMDRIGPSEIEIVNLVNGTVQRIVQMELRMEAGQGFGDLMETPAAPQAQASMKQVVSKARSTVLYGLATGLFANAICAVGGQAAGCSVEASMLSKTSSANAAVEEVCAQAFMNSIVNAVIVTDDKHDHGDDVVLSTSVTPAPQETEADVALNAAASDTPVTYGRQVSILSHKEASAEGVEASNNRRHSQDMPIPGKARKSLSCAPPSVPHKTGEVVDQHDESESEKEDEPDHPEDLATQTVEELRDKAHDRIWDRLCEGNLDEVFQAALAPEKKEEAPEEPIEHLQTKLFKKMTMALDDGSLDEVLASCRDDAHEEKEKPLGTLTHRGSLAFHAPGMMMSAELAKLKQQYEEETVEEGQEDQSEAPQVCAPPAALNSMAASSASPAASAPPASASKTPEQLLEDELRIKARETLVKASLCNDLEQALVEVHEERQAGLQAVATPTSDTAGAVTAGPSTPKTAAKESPTTPQAPAKSPAKTCMDGANADKPALVWALEGVSQRDQRVGELLAMISEAQRKLSEREATCQQIEERIGGARLDLAHVELDVEWHRRAIETARERTVALEAGQRKLMGDLDGQQQKLRHANIEAQESCVMSAQSEISTATGGATASSVGGCFTPLNALGSSLPLSPSPLSSRW